MARLLVVAINSELRHSLQFALEAEGHYVDTAARLDPTMGAEAEYDCVIVDHHATDRRSPSLVAREFRRLAPVGLLANGAGHPLAEASYRTVLKPMLGPALSRAVAEAIADNAAA